MITELKTALGQGVVNVTFVKTDGTKREMRATTNENLFSHTPSGLAKAANPNVTVLWDLDKGAFRSLRNDSLLAFTPE
jgi:hypothetical protein